MFGGFERTFPGGAVTEDLGVVKTDESDRGAGYGLHTTLRTRLFGRLTLLPGVRFDAYVWEGQRRYSVEPRLQARLMLAPKDRHLLKMSGGKYSKLPEPQELSDSLVTPSSSSKARGSTVWGTSIVLTRSFTRTSPCFTKRCSTSSAGTLTLSPAAQSLG